MATRRKHKHPLDAVPDSEWIRVSLQELFVQVRLLRQLLRVSEAIEGELAAKAIKQKLQEERRQFVN